MGHKSIEQNSYKRKDDNAIAALEWNIEAVLTKKKCNNKYGSMSEKSLNYLKHSYILLTETNWIESFQS